MSRKLTRAEREAIVIDHLKGKPTPGYNVIETKMGHYRVTPVKIEIDSDDDDESNCTAVGRSGEAEGEPNDEPKSERRDGEQKENVLELLNLIRNNLQDGASTSTVDNQVNHVNAPPPCLPRYRRRRLVF